MIRVMLVWINFGPYHIARLDALARLPHLNVLGVELSSVEALRNWVVDGEPGRFQSETLWEGAYETSDKTELARRVERIAEQFQPDALVISGYSEKPMRAAARWAKRRGRISILTSESHQADRARFWLKEQLKGIWVRRYFDAAFVGGERHVEYLSSLGFLRARIWRGYDVVDHAYFSREAARVREAAPAWRAKLGLPDRYFLYVGRFSAEKNLESLLHAFRFYRELAPGAPWALVMVGSGPLEARLKKMVHGRLRAEVIWPGFLQAEQLPTYYALASCLILPSRSEPWGLVVNEAMACGLPVLVSDRCGVIGDLVFPGINGYVFDPNDIDGLAFLMLRVASGRVDLDAMGAASRSIVARYSPELWAKALADCIAVSLERSPVKRSTCASFM